MSGEFGPGEVYNRRVTGHVQSLLPEQTRFGENYTFGGRTVLDDENNPGKPAGGTCRIKAYVGADGQITVLEKSEVTSGEDVLWASRNLIRRTHDVDGAEMEPFRYDVKTKIKSRDSVRSNRTTVALKEFTAKPVYGGREAQAAVLLAERIAIEKQQDHVSRDESCCSLQGLPSLPRVVDKGWIGLDWKDVNGLLGPEAETIAARVTVDSVVEDEREAAEAKGITIFTPSREAVTKPVEERTPTNARKQTGPPDDERFRTEIPDELDPDEAQQRLFQMIRQIQQMRSDE